MDEIRKDEGLKGNEKIEAYIGMLKTERSAEVLSAALSSIRRRMKEGGQFIVPVEPGKDGRLHIKVMQVDGRPWLFAFTGFEEELIGNNPVMSTFMADISQIFDMALSGDADGVILNPWNKTMRLDRELIRIIKGEMNG